MIILLTMMIGRIQAAGPELKLSSPNGRLTATLSTDEQKALRIAVSLDGESLMHPSRIGITLEDGTDIAVGIKTGTAKRKETKETIDAPFYRQKRFTTEYRQLELKLKDGFGIVLRAYDEGIAYRFYTTRKGETIIQNETAEFNFGSERMAWLPYSTNDEKPMAMAFQNIYHHTTIGQAERKLAFLPVTVDCGKAKVTLTEAELRSYPGMFVEADGDCLKGVFAKYPAEMDKYRWRGQSYVKGTENYIARGNGTRSYPWRVIAVAEKDTQMPVNNLVYALSEPNRIGPTDWIKPGKVAWDWWNDWNLKGVDFKAGINNETYKYFIDFAAANGIEYVVLDEGWYDSGKADIMNPIADIDLQGLIDYGRDRNVGIVLWAVFNVLDEHLEEACAKYAGMGAKGFKVDFLDRDDQTATEMAYRIAEAAARHHLILDYHGYYKPTGISRTYPNILNYEGVFGMEEARWTKIESDMPLYDVTFPFIRGMAGQVDFTPGALSNGTRNNWTAIYTKPMSMGTRCHQLACYVVHDSPFTMLCDAPTNYEREKECTRLIAGLPVTFDRTVIPQGELGKYIVTAREKDGNWYVGGQTNWEARDITLRTDFLEKGKIYLAELFRDGINADHNAEDYAREVTTVTVGDAINIHMAQGGGFVLKLTELGRKPAITEVPQGHGIPDFYKKYAETDGIYITTSEKVSDEAIEKACHIINLMLAKRPDIKEYMALRGCHVMIIGKDEQTCDLPEYERICDTPENIAYLNKRARGFGGAPEDDLSSSCGEENLLALPSDRYLGENIMVHEFSHLIHTIGICGVEPGFNRRLAQVMENAKAKGLWKDTYAMSCMEEYFAECVQSFFNCNRYAEPANGVHNGINTRERLKAYDPEMYRLLTEYFAETDCSIIPQNSQETTE